MKRQKINFKVKNKLEEEYTDGKTKCRCGHTQAMLPSTQSCICSHCGHKIINQSIGRFRYMFYQTRGEMNE